MSLTHEEAVRRARALAPAIHARVERCERERRVPLESVEEFVGAGLGRLLQPKRWGGYEVSHDAAFDVTVEIAAACGSTGWCLGFLNIHDWWLSAFPDEAQHDVWRDGPDVNTCTVIGPLSGTARSVDGGWRLKGQWSYASGVDYCIWAIVSAMTVAPTPEIMLFLVPAADYTVKDTWFNVGLRGSGSKDVIIDDAFVPAHRTLAFSDLRDATSPGARVNPGPIYQVPLVARLYALIAPALGIARGAFTEWIDWTRGRTASLTGQDIAASPQVQIGLAQAETEIDTAAFLLRRNLDFIRDGRPIDLATRALSTAGYAQAGVILCRAIDTLFRLSGSRGTFDANPIQRAWRDIHTITSHVGLNPESAGQLRGRALLGLPRDPKAQMY